MDTHRLELRLSDEDWDLLNRTRGLVPRATFAKAALMKELGRQPDKAPVPSRASESRRAPQSYSTTSGTPYSAQDAALERQAKLNKSKGF